MYKKGNVFKKKVRLDCTIPIKPTRNVKFRVFPLSQILREYRKSDISVDIQVEKLCVELHPDSLSDSDELECLSTETSDIES